MEGTFPMIFLFLFTSQTAVQKRYKILVNCCLLSLDIVKGNIVVDLSVHLSVSVCFFYLLYINFCDKVSQTDMGHIISRPGSLLARVTTFISQSGGVTSPQLCNRFSLNLQDILLFIICDSENDQIMFSAFHSFICFDPLSVSLIICCGRNYSFSFEPIFIRF